MQEGFPEACGLRHLAFGVADIDAAVTHLLERGVDVEPVRVDEYMHTAPLAPRRAITIVVTERPATASSDCDAGRRAPHG